jgi:xanthine dehydrogenase YagS FAD-binding subunit
MSTTIPATAFEWRAAGTDLSERRRSGVSRGPLRQIAPTPETTTLAWQGDGSLRIGAAVSIAAIAADTRLAAAYPGLAAAAGGLATPQIRNVGTLGGNLAQRSRCWYFRNPHLACLKKGGDACPARSGNHRYGVAFDLGPCVAPHPSTLAAALMAYEARIQTSDGMRSIADVMGDGRDGTRDNALAAHALISTVSLPVPLAGERASYRRAISRSYAEWPLVELVARAVIESGRVTHIALAAGGVAPVPLRLEAAEQALLGRPLEAGPMAAAAKAALTGARPLPDTAYKLVLLEGLVTDALERLAGPD